MDFNVIIIGGRLAAEQAQPPFASGARFLRVLVTVRSQEPRRRIDVLPVIMWGPDDSVRSSELLRGTPVWVAGAVQRRVWSADAGRTSRVEIVAHHIEIRTESVAGEESDSNAA